MLAAVPADFPETRVSRKTPDNPPPQNSLVRALVVPVGLFVGAIILALLVITFGDRITGGGGTDSSASRDGRTLDPQTMEQLATEFDRRGVAYGPDDASVVVREFADYQCPACAAFADTAARIRENYADEGKVRFVFYDFPLPMHQHARQAAAAARCAGRQGEFWAYHEVLFERQARWSSAGNVTGEFLDMAVESGVDADALEQCLDEGAADQRVAQSAAVAQQLRVTSTPTTMVGNKVFPGVVDYDTIAAEIDAQLQTAGQ